MQLVVAVYFIDFHLYVPEEKAPSSLKSLLHWEDSIYSKRSRVNWLKLGDRHSKFLHFSMKR